MTLQEMLGELERLGYSQRAIADAVGATQPTIHRAIRGASVRYETGKAIEALLKKARTAASRSAQKRNAA